MPAPHLLKRSGEMPRANLLLFILATACAESRAPAVGPAHPTTMPIEIVDEVASFETAAVEGNSFVVAPDGTIVIAESAATDRPTPGARVVALDDRLSPRWEIRATTEVMGMVPVGDATVIATQLEGNNETQLQLVDRTGTVHATTTFERLVGAKCAYGGRRWLAAEQGGFVAAVACGSPRQNWWVHVAADLGSATHEGANGASPFDAPAWMSTPVVHDLRYVHLGQGYTLARGLDDVARHTAAGTIVGIGGGDLLVGGTTVSRRAGSGMFATRAFVTRLGSRPWSTDVAPERETGDPQHVASVAVVGDGSVLAAVQYGHEVRLLGVRLPSPSRGDGAAMPRGVAITELDADRGDVRAIVVPRPRTPWAFLFFVHVGASPRHLVIADDHRVVVFPRRGKAIAPVPDLPVAAAPGIVEVRPAQELTPLPEMWSELCGPHVTRARNAPCRLEHVALGRDGTVAAGGSYYEANQVGKRSLPKQAYETGVLVVHGPDGALRWQKVFGVSWNNDVREVLIRDDGRVVITGIHGQHFSIDGVHLPERVVRKLDGQDMDFDAVIGYVAVFAPDGTLELLEDIDVLALGDRSTSSVRSCSGALARQAGAPEAAWLVAGCSHAMFRIPLRGATAGPPVAIGDLGGLSDTGWLVEPSGRVVGTRVGVDLSEVLVSDGARFAAVPVLADRSLGPMVATGDSGVWTGATLTDMDVPSRLVATRTAPGLERSTATLLASAPRSRIDGLTVDDAGRPIFAIQVIGQAITIGGQTIKPLTLDPQSPVQGRAFVRLTSDGSKIDRVFVPALLPNECTRPSHGLITSMAARGEALAVSFTFGVTPACGVKDEPSVVMVFHARA
ncbi:hypothetical protein BH11MYX1_BH11MYX1_24840 [soil metagenome]